MGVLHYGNFKIELSDDDVQKFTGSRADLSKPALHSVQLANGWIHFVTGPGIPLLIDERDVSTGMRLE